MPLAIAMLDRFKTEPADLVLVAIARLASCLVIVLTLLGLGSVLLPDDLHKFEINFD